MGAMGGSPMGAPSGVSANFNVEIDRLCQRFNLDERIKGQLVDEMTKRTATFDDDMRRLNEIPETARNPPGLLSVKLREMREGTFGTYGAGGGGGGGGAGLGPGGGMGGGMARGGMSDDRKR